MPLISHIDKDGLLTILTGGDMATTAISILWVSAVASALVDNIPFVATMIPMIQNMESTLGGPEALMPYGGRSRLAPVWAGMAA